MYIYINEKFTNLSLESWQQPTFWRLSLCDKVHENPIDFIIYRCM